MTATTQPLRNAAIDARLVNAALVLGGLGTLASAWDAFYEYRYWSDHPYRTGVSGILIVLALGAALGCAAVTLLAWAVLHPRHS